MILKKILLPAIFLLSLTYVQAQNAPTEVPESWFHLDPTTDHYKGVSADKAHAELLKDKKSKTVIVAVIDGGTDVEHEDLKANIWINADEIAGNGIDDDKNGYIDDVHGWNFIGNAKGEMIDHDNLEVTRLYAKYRKIYEGKTTSDFKGKKLAAFNEYLAIKEDFESKVKAAKQPLTYIEGMVAAFNKSDSTMKAELKKDEYTIDEVKAFESENEDVKKAKETLITFDSRKMTVEGLQGYLEHFQGQLEYHYNIEFEPRSLVGDDYENKKEKYYGNNKLKGPDGMHGTHVAGTIGAVRNNDIGMNGVANDVKIMVVRVVPDGDERDKDVANGIIYAVDNGAQIINMSFGKSYSPYKKVVDKAIKYAEKKGVLLVHAAGNDGQDNDLKKNFPNAGYLKGNKRCKTWIEVGASSWHEKGNFAAGFSNYGQKTVDIFAPGMQIYATIPDNKYGMSQGTSMASPVVAGVAALVLSYYPNLTAVELKDILLKSVSDYGTSEVNLPGTKDKKTKFKTLSVSGGVVNAYNALKLAESMSK
ncbi:MAG: peptidase S8 [Bacteroidetes bacterium]|nr:MAG: peptidase S8 [Bacteroidota bacterium]